MAGNEGDRTRHFPAIEKKHGGPASKWVKAVKDLGDAKYAEQVAFLRENHGFSQAHANAVVMYARGSVSSRRHDTPEAFLGGIDEQAAATVRAVFAAATKRNKGMELVIAWNQPCLRKGKAYVLGISVSKQHLTLNPFSKDVIDAFATRLADLGLSKHTFKVPYGWKPDAALIDALVKARLAEID
jgi:uncharacterized protein YdhG (YjbR/CyaY superfamily)